MVWTLPGLCFTAHTEIKNPREEWTKKKHLKNQLERHVKVNCFFIITMIIITIQVFMSRLLALASEVQMLITGILFFLLVSELISPQLPSEHGPSTMSLLHLILTWANPNLGFFFFFGFLFSVCPGHSIFFVIKCYKWLSFLGKKKIANPFLWSLDWDV